MRYFRGISEIALQEEDVKQAINEFLKKRFNTSVADFQIENIRHCRSDSRYCLRFEVSEKS